MSSRVRFLHPLIVVAAWLTGNALQLQQADLWPGWAYGIGAGLGVVACAAALMLGPRMADLGGRGRGRGRAWLTMLIVTLSVLAFCVAGLRAHARLSTPLDPALEGVDLVLTGVVASLPRTSPDGLHLVFDVESAQRGDLRVSVPSRVSLGWYREGFRDRDDGLDSDLPRVAAAERWQFTARLRRPHSLMNPHGFDFELWLFERGISATGAVRPAGDNRRLGLDEWRVVERSRQAVRDAIERRVADPRASGLLAALAIGDQSAIDRGEWDLYRITGVSHLMSISGLHVTMFAWLAASLVGWLWRRSLRACLGCPAPTAARVGGVMLAAAYAVLAGWGVPAQRTVWMLVTVVALQVLGRRWPWHWTLAVAALVVVLIDPWAWLQPGFWLSFVAVGLLMLGDGARQSRATASVSPSTPTSASTPTPTPTPTFNSAPTEGLLHRVVAPMAAAARNGLRTQVIATVGLAPLTLVFFQQISLVGFVANLIAIPLVTLLITPLALAGLVVPPLWSLAAGVIDGLHQVLAWMAAWPVATWTTPVAPWWAQAAGLAAGLLAVAPLPWRARALALPLVLPLLWPALDRPPQGRFDVVAVDVGQGSAVLLRTQTKLMVFDTGPVYARERDAGERVLVPLLRARGEPRIDRLILSHQDTDHVGGAGALLSALPVTDLWSSLPHTHPLRRGSGLDHQPCEAGASWVWDGVRFDVLHPQASDLQRPSLKPNALSCVVRVVDAQGQTLLLTGDIEAAQEQALVASGIDLRAHALIVAHHGSRTSTTPAWLDAVAPTVAVVQAGYRNRFGHPALPVQQRLQARNIRLHRSDACGAWTWRSGDAHDHCEREARRRYWHLQLGHLRLREPAELSDPSPGR